MSTDASLPDDPELLKALLLSERTAREEERQRFDSQRQQYEQTLSEYDQTLSDERQKVTQLEQRIAALLRQLNGSRQERIDPGQLLLFDLDELSELIRDGQSAADGTSGESDDVAAGKKPSRRGHGRRRLPSDLPREQVIHDLEPEQRLCACCGRERHEIGTESSEQLEYVPARWKVIEHIRKTYACDHCDGQVQTAPKPPQPIDKGLPGPGLLAYCTLAKYGDHMPLYRLEDISTRFGHLIRRSTICGWIAAVSELVRPLYDLMCERVRLSDVIHTDDTKVKLLVPGAGKAHTARFWVYIGDTTNPYTVFDFTKRRERDGPDHFLQDFSGYLQADAYSAYDGLYLDTSRNIVEVGCWTHCRRYWWEARDNDSRRAHEALAFIARLYEVERALRERPFAEIAVGREQHARPILSSFGEWLTAQAENVLPKSVIGKAFTYTRNQWDCLQRYVDDGRLSIDNNVAEQAVKIPAIGRKNWMFVASETGGERAAILLSLTASCKACGVEPWAWLRDVFERLPTLPPDELPELLPDAWLQSHPDHRWEIDDIRRRDRQRAEQNRRRP